MMPNARPKTARDRTRRFRWPFAKKRNRRVRPATGREPSGAQTREPSAEVREPTATQKVAKPPRAPGSHRRPLFVVLVLAALGGSGVGAHRFVTRSKHFAVRNLRFSPVAHVDLESLQARAGLAVGTNLFAVDLAEIERKVLEEPWVKEAHARRELPSTIAVDVVEREAACVVALNALYLADARGVVFKRATPDEAAALPVVTGIERDVYLAEPDHARAHVREALEVAVAWQKGAGRPALGEVHWDRLLGITVYTREGAVGVRLGRNEDLEPRLRRFDAVWAELARAGDKPRVIYLDNRARPDRVTVKLASPPAPPADGGKRT